MSLPLCHFKNVHFWGNHWVFPVICNCLYKYPIFDISTTQKFNKPLCMFCLLQHSQDYGWQSTPYLSCQLDTSAGQHVLCITDHANSQGPTPKTTIWKITMEAQILVKV